MYWHIVNATPFSVWRKDYRLIPLVAALLSQRLLVDVDEIPVGGKQVGRTMQHAGHGHVRGDEVVEPIQGAGDFVLGRLGRLGLQAEHSPDVLLALVNREIAPVG
jgi:hypothetical protein